MSGVPATGASAVELAGSCPLTNGTAPGQALCSVPGSVIQEGMSDVACTPGDAVAAGPSIAVTASDGTALASRSCTVAGPLAIGATAASDIAGSTAPPGSSGTGPSP